MATFGEGLGGFIGGALAHNDISQGQKTVSNIGNAFDAKTQPYNTFGQSFLDPATGAISGINDVAGTVKGYDQFMSDYQTTPAAQYQMAVADNAQNNSAAARGGLLSGQNMRELSTINQGIASQAANTAYSQYLAGNNQQFGQLETALGNMFQAIGIGQTATGQQASVDSAQMNAQAQLAAAKAKSSGSKGSGLGSMFSGLGSFAALF